MIIRLVPRIGSKIFLADILEESIAACSYSRISRILYQVDFGVRYKGNTNWNYCIIDDKVEPPI